MKMTRHGSVAKTWHVFYANERHRLWELYEDLHLTACVSEWLERCESMMQAAALNSFATHILSDRHSIILTAVALSASAWHTPMNTQTHTNCLLWMKDVDVGNTLEIKWNCSHVDVLSCKYLSVCVNVHVWV